MLDGVSVLASVRRRTSWQILLVREDEQKPLLHFPVAQYAVELLLRLIYTIPVLTVDDEDETLGACVVMPPQWSDLVLTTDIPDVELDILIGYGLDVEPN